MEQRGQQPQMVYVPAAEVGQGFLLKELWNWLHYQICQASLSAQTAVRKQKAANQKSVQEGSK